MGRDSKSDLAVAARRKTAFPMIIRDPDPLHKEFDVCVVGAGPVGLAAALECEAQGLSVLLLESGHLDPRPDVTQLSLGDITDPRRHAPMDIAVCRAFGGTSWLWGGRCVPFNDIDFEVRSHVPNSGWPLSPEELSPWRAAASAYLDCGQDIFMSGAPGWEALPGGVTADGLERWSRQPILGPSYRKRLQSAHALELRLGHTVVGLDLSQGTEQLDALVVSSSGQRAKVRAQNYVLACGGLECTRLLLAAQKQSPRLFGGADGPLGRFYMGHVFGHIADIIFYEPRDALLLNFELDETETYVRRRLSLGADVQRREQLLNANFWIDNPPFYDAGHRNGVLSIVFLALSIPPLGRRLVSEAIRRAHVGPPPAHYWRHILNILASPHQTAAAMLDIVRQRYLARTRKPGYLVRNRHGLYALKYHAEQIPRAESRVRLSASSDELGLQRLCVDLRYCEDDARSVVRSHELLDKGLRAAKKGELRFCYPQPDLVNRVLEQASDGFHQMGTTRMGTDPDRSVVNRDCRVHDIKNLYVASSSVFPTSGQANPTFLATVLAVRLAHHLAARMRCMSQGATPSVGLSGCHGGE